MNKNKGSAENGNYRKQTRTKQEMKKEEEMMHAGVAVEKNIKNATVSLMRN